MRYSTEPRFRKYVQGYVLSFARKFGNKYGKKINATKTTATKTGMEPQKLLQKE